MNGKKRWRIVVAEDDAPTRALLVRQLRNAEYDVVACADGQQALTAVQEEHACIVLADWMMPGMDGPTLCRAIRGLAEQKSVGTVYFILLTAQSQIDDVVEGFESGADDYLTKPYQKPELIARLRAGERIVRLQEQLRDNNLQLESANAEMRVLNARLEQLANTDSLTAIANRRYLFDRLHQAWLIAERHNQPLGCIMLDIDHFKSFNDTYGHAVGDIVLRRVCDIVRRQIRGYDLFGRFGGEEFALVCPYTDLRGTATLAERLRVRIAEAGTMKSAGNQAVTVSVGVSARRSSHASCEALIAEADALLYRAKQGGRNQVWLATEDGRGRRFLSEACQLAQ